jgi:hypothetical protein
MTTKTEQLLSTSWNLVREAGSAVTDAAANSQVGTRLARNLPKLKEVVSVGAGLALARRGSKVAVAAVRRNPVAAIAGAVALAGVGIAVTVINRRKKALANDGIKAGTAAAAKPRRLAAKNMRGSETATTAKAKAAPAKAARKAPAKRKPKAGS